MIGQHGLGTFLIIFLTQRQQNKENMAIHVKLNELIAALQQADKAIINIEEMTENDIRQVYSAHRDIADKHKKKARF